MASLQCPHCGTLIPASAEKSPGTFQCPSCGQSASLRPVSPPSGQVPVRPSRPGVLTFGLALYIISGVCGLLAEFARSDLGHEFRPDIPLVHTPDQAIGFAVLGVFMILFGIVDLFSVICAFYGHAFGAILQILLFFPSLGVAGVAFGIAQASGSYNIAGYNLMLVGFALGIASFVCFIVPPAWAYYKECARYRIAKAFAEMPRR